MNPQQQPLVQFKPNSAPIDSQWVALREAQGSKIVPVDDVNTCEITRLIADLATRIVP